MNAKETVEVPSRKRFMAMPRHLAIRLIALLLALAIAFSVPLSALADANRGATGEALAAADAVKQKALRRLNEEAVRITGEDRRQLKLAVQDALRDLLQPLEASFTEAQRIVAREIGALDSRETVERKIEEALERASVPEAMEQLEEPMKAALAEASAATYAAYRTTFDTILENVIEESGLLGPLTDSLVEELKVRISHTSRSIALKQGVGGLDLSGSNTPDKVLITAAVALAVHQLLAGKFLAKLAAKLGFKMGGKLLAKGLAAKTIAVWLGPLAWIAISLAVLKDIDEARTQKIEAAQNALRQGYAMIEKQLLTGEFLDDAAAAAVEGLEQQLQRDREAARTELEDFFRGLMVQAKSPGFAAFVAEYDEEEGVRALKKVSATFGTQLATEVEFGLKYELASRIDAAHAGGLIDRHGIGFVELFSRQPETVAQIAIHPRYPELFQHVMHAGDPDAEMQFFKRSLDRFGTLDEEQLEALLLTRLLHPAKRPEDIGKPALTVLGSVADQLNALARYRPETAARVVDWTLRGMVSGALLKRLSERTERERLFAVMTELGPDTFERSFATAGSQTLLAFVEDFTASWDAGQLAGSQAMALLRADPQGYLQVYAREDGGGKRAVVARHTLRQSYGSALSADTENRLHWLLVHTGFDPRDLTRAAMEDLRVVGIPNGWWPDFIALPLAKLIVRIGLTWVVVLPLLLIALLFLALVAAMFLRTLRLMPLRGRLSAGDRRLDAINVHRVRHLQPGTE